MISAAFWSVLGATVASVLACVPSLHIYNVLGMAALVMHSAGAAAGMQPEVLVPLTAGMVTGWSMANAIPSILLAAPDESAVLTVLPGQKYAMEGRGLEAVMITSCGGLAGLIVLLLVAGPLVPRTLAIAWTIFHQHVHWILWTVIVFMLMGEWPKFGTRGQGGWRRFLRGWISPGAGLLTFLLSGLVGFLLRYKSPISAEVAFQNLMPAFVGLFAVPWLICNVVNQVRLPEQTTNLSLRLCPHHILRGGAAGFLGGMFAAFFPGITGGVGGLLAGHATAQRDERVFLVAQGSSKLVYYVGALLFLFVPGRNLTRGTAAWLMRGFNCPHTWNEYYTVLGSVAIAGAVSFMLMKPLACLTIRATAAVGYKAVSVAALTISLAIVLVTTGCMGLAVMIVCSGIGLIPVLFGSRRLNCLGIILLPMACSMSGAGSTVATWLGLV